MGSQAPGSPTIVGRQREGVKQVILGDASTGITALSPNTKWIRSAQSRLRRTPPVDDPFGSRYPLRDALHLGGARGDCARAAEVAGLRHHDTEGQRNQRRVEHVPGAILAFAPATLAAVQ